MVKIVSRPSAEDTGLQQATDRLTEILGKHTNGMIGKGPSSVAAPKDFEEAASAVDLSLKLAISAITTLKTDLMLLEAEYQMQWVRLEKTLQFMESLVDVGYDDSLEKAVDELLQTAEAAGFGETDADGHLSFYPGTRFSRGDLKPFIQTVIEAWVEQKIKDLP